MKTTKLYQMPTFKYSRKKYNCYIYYGAFDHKKGNMFKDKIRILSDYSSFKGFEELRSHFNDRKLAITEYVNEHIIPKISDDLINGQLDKGIDVKIGQQYFKEDAQLNTYP